MRSWKLLFIPLFLLTLPFKATGYCGAGIVFESASVLARIGWGISFVSPWASHIGKECHFFSQLCDRAAKRAFGQMFKTSSTEIPPSQTSWHEYHALLSQIPTMSDQEKKLLVFLENRWLAKSTGFFSFVIDWVCPCFGVHLQVHPETTSSYSRAPSTKLTETYKHRVEALKQALPHPHSFPLILTRPSNLRDYLPHYQEFSDEMVLVDSKVILDFSKVLTTQNRDEWIQTWERYQDRFSHSKNIICIQRVENDGIGGIRLLPLKKTTPAEIEAQHKFLLEWVSHFGLSTNRVELDRSPVSWNPASKPIPIKTASKEEFLSFLTSFENGYQSCHPQKQWMIRGTLRLLKGLLSHEKWDVVSHSPTRSALAGISFAKIQEQYNLLKDEKQSFFETTTTLEQIHAHISSLLEISKPFEPADFSSIYQHLLTTLPENLKSVTTYAVHASGMTSLTGIFKATEKMLKKPSRVLYGENAYYECMDNAKLISHAAMIDEATEEDWKEVDLILAQFSPSLKKVIIKPQGYRIEKVRETLRRTLQVRNNKPLTLALDCTLDYINSPRVGQLFKEFEHEIESGILNVVCYRSGLKFDLFGMDNYCGAPLFMTHNQDPKWDSFAALLTDPVLQTDSLSLNWFCLAYQNAAPELETYRKQIFDNTRALLNQVPARLLHDKTASYRIIPVEKEAEAAFIDIKIYGTLHQIRGSALVGGLLYMQCMEEGQPIFFRPSLGFYHPNFTMIFDKECTTIRLTLGLDPAQIPLLTKCFEKIDQLNEPVNPIPL